MTFHRLSGFAAIVGGFGWFCIMLASIVEISLGYGSDPAPVWILPLLIFVSVLGGGGVIAWIVTDQ